MQIKIGPLMPNTHNDIESQTSIDFRQLDGMNADLKEKVSMYIYRMFWRLNHSFSVSRPLRTFSVNSQMKVII